MEHLIMKITFIGMILIFLCAAIGAPGYKKVSSKKKEMTNLSISEESPRTLVSQQFSKSIWIKFNDNPYRSHNLSENTWVVDQQDKTCHN